MSAPVTVHQHERELQRLLELYERERPQSVLEIGVAQGGTLWHWLTRARDDVPVTIVCVDDFATFEDNRTLFSLWTPPNVTLHVIEGQSGSAHTAAHVFDICESYDWVFIDGDHSFEAVLLDWTIYGARANTVVFHDIVSDPIFHPEIKVRRLWDELREQYETLEIVDDASAAWGGFGVLWTQS